jgi:hypothetical protein
VRSAGNGSKGGRWYAWALIATASPRHHLLVRRHLKTCEKSFRMSKSDLQARPDGRPSPPPTPSPMTSAKPSTP